MNLRNAENYTIGLDIGTASVGWCVVDENAKLYKIKGKNTWGSRLFDGAETAAATRIFRAQRRRYDRRKFRLQLLQELFQDEMNAVDPSFFARMRESFLWQEDRTDGLFDGKYVFFNGQDYDEQDYYAQFPTIYHLRKYLVETNEKADIRLIYLALHHMVKFRGHFLTEGSLSAKNSDAHRAASEFLAELQDHLERLGCETVFEETVAYSISELLSDNTVTRGAKRDHLTTLLVLEKPFDKLGKLIASAIFNYKTEFSNIFSIEKNGSETSFIISSDKAEIFEQSLPEDERSFFTCLKNMNSANTLAEILNEAPGETISATMVARFLSHSEELEELKRLIKTYAPEKYYECFRGPAYADGTYKKSEAKGYTAYVLNGKRDVFYDYIKHIFKNVHFKDTDSITWDTIQSKISEDCYMQKLRTRDNGAIPHQLHLEEMQLIINNQKKYYDFLQRDSDKLCSLISFRLPYYVGPLGTNKNPERKKAFGWAVRQEGMESARVTPWNFDAVIDRDESAKKFIENLTGKCTYLMGEDTMPARSLLYAEFCVRQELNVCTAMLDGNKPHRFSKELVDEIISDLFMTRKTVSVKTLRTYLKSKGYLNIGEIRGMQKESEFASQLVAYNDFRNILGHDIESSTDIKAVEEMILWITIFEDKDIRKRKIKTTYGPQGNGMLTSKQVNKIAGLRYSGWSRLSETFLLDLKASYDGTYYSIMDVLRDSEQLSQMNLMEIISDKRFGFKQLIEERNQKYFNEMGNDLDLDDIPGSPAIKRGINQTLKIVDELIKITGGKEPAEICVEIAREEVGKNKGNRTSPRIKELEESYKKLKNTLLADESTQSNKKLREYKDLIEKDRYFLYFLQMGKCIYTGAPLDINRLNDYHVDHIIPQSYIKDDSISNKVLCTRSANETKLDSYPIPEAIRRSNIARWRALTDAGLMSKKKFANLTRAIMDEKTAKGFINRQLVETRQITKHVINILQSRYPNTTVKAIKAELSSDLRKQYGFIKLRDLNDYHHAHDAYIACCLNHFIGIRYPGIERGLDFDAFLKFTKHSTKNRDSTKGFIVSSFGKSGFDLETGEISKDTWGGQLEVERMRKCLNYKDCFISKKTKTPGNGFWDETIYSRREAKPEYTPRKANLDVMKYGFYSHVNLKHYCLVEMIQATKGKRKNIYQLVGIPIYFPNNYKASDLQTELSKTEKNEIISLNILLDNIPKYQLIRWKNTEFYLTSCSEIMQATQLTLSQKSQNIAYRVYSEMPISDSESLYLIESIIEKININYSRPKIISTRANDPSFPKKFINAEVIQKKKMLSELFNMLHANPFFGLSAWGLSGTTGRMPGQSLLGKELAVGAIKIVDTSTTGIYEKVRTIGL